MAIEHDPMTADELVENIKSAILDLNHDTYGGYSIAPEHAEERARNIATWVLMEIQEQAGNQ